MCLSIATALSIEMKVASRSILLREITWANVMLVNADTDDEPRYTAKCYVDNWRLIMAKLDDYHRRQAQLSLGSNYFQASLCMLLQCA